MPSWLRAVLTWLVIYVALMFLLVILGVAFGGISSYEIGFVFLVSVALTFVALRRSSRVQGRRAGSDPTA